MKNSEPIIISSIVLLILIFAGIIIYSNYKPITATPPGKIEVNKTTIANPASTYCESNGGKLEIITATDGSQSGQCTLSDGTKCEEWALFRGECGKQKHVCTEAEKQNQICTMEYIGVCGNDDKTYATGCTACASKIDSYVMGECPGKNKTFG